MHTLSKSDFKLACSCATKLYYKERRYPSTLDDDPYLALLADGGYMVEAIARILYEPEGRVLPFHGATAEAARVTAEALTARDAVLFEATLLSGIKMARVDILVKRGDAFELIEVKSKSYDGDEARRRAEERKPSIFHGVQGAIDSEWTEYLLDVAYQTQLLKEIYPAASVMSFLLMPDTSKSSGLEDIYRQFSLTRAQRAGESFERTEVEFIGDPAALRADHFLTKVEVSSEVAELMDLVRERTAEFAASLSPELRKIVVPISTACAGCEYRVGPEILPNGFAECWGDRAHVAYHILDLYKGSTIKRGKEVKLLDQLIAQGAASILDVPESELVGSRGTVGANNKRQLTQIHYTRRGSRWVDDGLAAEMAKATYPLHFMDFETSALAVPYHAGMRPYATAAFQWSCYTIAEPGAPAAHAEWLNVKDAYPNFAFARSLRERIGDTGTALMWATHERTTLKTIGAALAAAPGHDDELAAWIEDITRKEDPRLLDMNALTLHHYFDPLMKGRTSIKVVLDAVWKSDPLAREEFPEYRHGADSPYKALPPLVIGGHEVAVREGLGAVRAYQEMMYGAGRGDAASAQAYRELLLNYCKLDTAAMVIIWRHWERVSKKSTVNSQQSTVGDK